MDEVHLRRGQFGRSKYNMMRLSDEIKLTGLPDANLVSNLLIAYPDRGLAAGSTRELGKEILKLRKPRLEPRNRDHHQLQLPLTLKQPRAG